ncbi:MAG: histone H1 [Gammaproteobacteria bacterium]|nr:histone H1 [Gammaproteobacteria bacterium]
MKQFEELKDFVAGLEDDFVKFYEKGNKAAGVRVRKSMQQLKAKAQDIRVDVQEKVRAGPEG